MITFLFVILILAVIYLIGVVWMAIATYGDPKFGSTIKSAITTGLWWQVLYALLAYVLIREKLGKK